MDASEPEQPAEPEPLRTLCPHCSGMGVVSQPRLALYAGSGVTIGVPETCPHCQGTRWLPGLQPPL
ncbi:MAG: hypothetical protein ACRDSP_15855 [Pseudonocardiaceae bacterium]